MLLNWAMTKEGKKEAEKLMQNFKRSGQIGVNTNNFIELNCSYITYILEGHIYRGFFTREQEDNLFKILDYFPGRISTIN